MARNRPVELLDRRDFPILYVDDEPENLRAFELTFRREFTILTATSAEEGMAMLNENPVAVVLSDHKMPGITGVDFLSRVRDFDPKATRMLVTAYGDAETLGHAINDGCIYRYIPKPWEPDDMRLALRQAIDLYALDRERDTLLDELNLLARLTRSLYRELDLDRLFATLLDAVDSQLGYDGTSLLLFDDARETLRWEGMRPMESEVSERVRTIRIDRATAPEFFDHIELGMVQTLTAEGMAEFESPIRTWITEVSAQELLVVPLTGTDGALGALAIDNRRGGRRFGANDRTLLGGLATQAVVAIENARMVEALRTSRSELRRAERMGVFGFVAREFAAEMQPLLLSMQSFLGLAPQKRDSEDPSFWDEAHSQVTSDLDRMCERLAAIQQLSRDEDRSRSRSADLRTLLSQAIEVLEPIAAQREASFELNCDETLPPVRGNRGEIRQVLLSLGLMAARRATARSKIEFRLSRTNDLSTGGVELVLSGAGALRGEDGSSRAGFQVCREIVEDCGGSFEEAAGGNPSSLRIVLPEGSALD